MATKKKKLDKPTQKPVKGSRKKNTAKPDTDTPVAATALEATAKPKMAAKLKTSAGSKTKLSAKPPPKKTARTRRAKKQKPSKKMTTSMPANTPPKTTPTETTAPSTSTSMSPERTSKYPQKRDDSPKISLPDLNWKTATCVVCGKPFDYHGRRKPKTCRNGACRYRYEYKIEPEKWAGHQNNLFRK